MHLSPVGRGRRTSAASASGEGGQTFEVGSPSPASHLRCSAPSPHWGEGKFKGAPRERDYFLHPPLEGKVKVPLFDIAERKRVAIELPRSVHSLRINKEDAL